MTKPTTPASNVRTINVPELSTVSLEHAVAIAGTMPEMSAAITLEKFAWSGIKTKADDTMPELVTQTKRVNDGDMTRIEAMLTSQMHTLDGMFNALARRAMDTTSVDQVKLWLTASLKAQRQCVQAAEALATLKNPAVFVGKQQINQSAGPMQVNNGTPSPAPVKSNPDTELKGITHEHIERLDTGAPSTTGRDDPGMATVGEVHRTQDRSRKGQERG